MKILSALLLVLALVGCQCTVESTIAESMPIQLTAEEQAYVASKEFTMGYPSAIHPIVFDNNGMPDGLAAKYAKLIVKRTGLRLRYLSFRSNALYTEAFAANGFDLLMVAAVRADSIKLVTDPYFRQNNYLLVDQLPIQFPMKVGVGSRYSLAEAIKKLGGSVTFVSFKNDETSFTALMAKELGGAVMGQAVSDYLEQKYDRKFAHSKVNFVHEIRFGCHINDVMLCGILNKAVNSITPEERAVFERDSLTKPLTAIEEPMEYGKPQK